MGGREEDAFDEARAFELCGCMSCKAVSMRVTLRPGKHDITMDGHPPSHALQVLSICNNCSCTAARPCETPCFFLRLRRSAPWRPSLWRRHSASPTPSPVSGPVSTPELARHLQGEISTTSIRKQGHSGETCCLGVCDGLGPRLTQHRSRDLYVQAMTVMQEADISSSTSYFQIAGENPHLWGLRIHH